MQELAKIAPKSAQNIHTHLYVEGVDCVRLAHKEGTPLYVMDEGEIVANLQEFADTLKQSCTEQGLPESQIAYAAKSFLCKAMIELVQTQGLWLDCLAGGEFKYAVQMGFDPAHILLHGNNKSEAELTEAIKANVGLIVVDNMDELQLIGQILADDASILKHYPNAKISILLRVTPGVDAHTHEFISTGVEDSKFGFNIANGAALEAVNAALNEEKVELKGLHCHIGSQVLELAAYKEAIEIVLDFAEQVRQQCKHTFTTFDLGGGLGINYTQDDDAPSITSYVRQMCTAVAGKCRAINYPLPSIILEPGRAVIGRPGLTLYTVGASKTIPGLRNYLFVDGGMSDNIRPALYSAEYTTVLANKMGSDPNQTYTIAGKHCESGDIVAQDQALPTPAAGDILAVFATGAYNYAMASNYNGQTKPAVVFVKNGKSRVVVGRQSIDQLWQNDV